ncbi:MAG: hypothetical protein R2761_28140 [Acidimicrobiales bacterium]
MDTRTYQQILQARRAEWEALHRSGRRRRVEAARARSAERWADEATRPAQELRAARLRLVMGLPPDAPGAEPDPSARPPGRHPSAAGDTPPLPFPAPGGDGPAGS